MWIISSREQVERLRQAVPKVEEVVAMLRPVAEAAELAHVEDALAWLEDDVLSCLRLDLAEAEHIADADADAEDLGLPRRRAA